MSKIGNAAKAVVAEMTGKIQTNSFFTWAKVLKTWNNYKVTMDYSRNDYDLSRSVYYASNINKAGTDFLLGSAFGKPIVNATAAFAIGTGFKVRLKGASEGNAIQEAEDNLNEWLEEHQSELFDWAKHGYRDGDSYVYIDELGNLDEFDGNTVTIVTDPLKGTVIGFNVEETVYEIDPSQQKDTSTDQDSYVIVKEFRTDSIRYVKYAKGDTTKDKPEVLFQRVFTVDEGAVEPEEDEKFLLDQIEERPLPVIHLGNEKEPRALYGNSDYQNVYIFMKEYHRVFQSGLRGVNYNNTPIPWLKGVANKGALTSESHKNSDATGKDKEKLEWGQDTIFYLNGPNAGAGFLQAQGVMDDTAKAMEKLFYNIVQASETPEFVFGTAVRSSKASVSEQMPVVIQKAERKRTQLKKPLKKLIQAYIDRRVRLSDPLFLAIKGIEDSDISFDFPELTDEDGKLTVEIIKFLLENGLISNRTVLNLLMSTKIRDIDRELEEAKKDAEESNQDNNITPEERQRLLDELNNLPSDSPENPEETEDEE